MSSFDWSGGGGGGSTPDADATTKGSIKLTNNLSGTADLPEVVDLTIAGEQLGSILYHNGTDWIQLPPGSATNLLSTNGVGFAPSWISVNSLIHSGTANLSFGAAPGGNYAAFEVTGQTLLSKFL